MVFEVPRDSKGIALDDEEWKRKREKLGLCIGCSNRLYNISKGLFSKKKIPLTNDHVYHGRCLNCDPLSTRDVSVDIEDSEKLDHEGKMKTSTLAKDTTTMNRKNRQKKKNVTKNQEIKERRRLQGLCKTCPNRLYRFEDNPGNPLHRTKVPITNSRVNNGHCLDCHPVKTARDFTPTENKLNKDAEDPASDSEAQNIHRNPIYKARRNTKAKYGEDDISDSEAHNIHRNPRSKAHKNTRAEYGEDAISDSEAQNIHRNSRSKVCRNSRAGLFSSGTFADKMLNEVADEIKDYNNEPPESSQFKQRISKNRSMITSSFVRLPQTDSDKIQLKMNTLQSFRFRKSSKWSTSEMQPLSDEHYDFVGNTILQLLTESLDVGKKLSLIEDLLSLVHDKLAKAEILMSGGMRAIHKIMTEDVDDEYLQLKTLTLLKNLIPFSDEALMEDAPLVEDILNEMVRHEKCLEIQENGIICLIEILKKNNKYKSIINQKDGINVVLSTLEKYTSSRIVEDGNLLITSLID